jgi:hypothetical protein
MECWSNGKKAIRILFQFSIAPLLQYSNLFKPKALLERGDHPIPSQSLLDFLCQ